MFPVCLISLFEAGENAESSFVDFYFIELHIDYYTICSR